MGIELDKTQEFYLIWGLRALLFLVVLIAVHYFLKYFRESRIISNSVSKIYGKAEEKYHERLAAKEAKRLEEGNIKDASLLNKLDFLIERSHIKNTIPFLNTEVYMLFIIVTMALGLVIGTFILGFWMAGVVIALGVIITSYGIMYMKASRNYDKIDSQMLTMLNIMENYSGSTDDILSIIGGTYGYLKEPLRSYLEEFYTETSITGDIGASFQKLEVRIENERLRDTIRNLEICSRHDANYREIIEDSKRSLKEYLRAKEKRKAITVNGRIEITVTIAMAIGTVVMFDGLMGGIMEALLDTFIGNVLLVAAMVVFAFAAINAISIDKGDRN